MITRFLAKTSKGSVRLLRYFGEVATADAAGDVDTSISHYVNGQLQKRQSLTLKKSEDIEG